MSKILFLSVLVFLVSGCSPELSGRDPDAVIRGVHYVGLVVEDLDRAQDFYSDTLNLGVTNRSKFRNDASFNALAGREDVVAKTSLMKSANAQLRMMEFEEPSQAALRSPRMEVYGPGIAHVCFQVNQHTHSYQRFLKAGGAVIGDAEMVHVNPGNPVYYAYAYDLDGAIVEIEHVDVDKLDLPEPPKNDYRIRHVSIATPNMDRAVDFYSYLLQEEVPRQVGRWISLSGDKADAVTGQENSKLKFTWFQVRNLEFEIIQYTSHDLSDTVNPRPFDAKGYNLIVFDVTNLDVARQRFIEAGGSLLLDNQMLDGAETFFGRDPDGNLLGFQVFPDSSAFSSQNFPDNGI